MTEFKSQICTTVEQSKRLLGLGLKKETADMRYYALYISTVDKWYNKEYPEVLYDGERINNHDIPAWSLHRLIEILDTNPCVFYTNCGYDNIIDRIEDYIKEGIIDTRYLEEWCLNEEE